MSNNYVMIGNFGLDYDYLQNQFLDASTGRNFRDFFQQIKAVTDALGLEIVEFFDNALVVTGDEQDKKYLENYFDFAYSFACIDKNNLELARECEYRTYQPTFVGCTRFSGPQATSEIKLPPNKSTMRYDA